MKILDFVLLSITALALVMLWKRSFWVRAYLISELSLGVLLERLKAAGVQRSQIEYEIIFILSMGIVFFIGTIYAGECFLRSPDRLLTAFISFDIPAFILCIVYLGLRMNVDKVPHYVWIALCLGFLEGMIGIIAANSPGTLARAMGTMWLLQCCYQFTFAVGITKHHETWHIINGWLPAIITIFSMGLLVTVPLWPEGKRQVDAFRKAMI